MKKRNYKFRLFFIILIGVAIGIVGSKFYKASYSIFSLKNRSLESYAKKNGIDMSEYPEALLALYERNPDTREFVFEYPEKKDLEQEIDLSQYENSKTVPLLMQWDQDWGYAEYAGEIIGLSGCGPTCLSMVAIYITGDVTLNPKIIAEFATENEYAVDGNGSKWTLFSEGAECLGMNVKELPLDENRIISNLEVGNPIICAMGQGDFTTTGHFIVMVGYEDGKIQINDPNSYDNSEKLWSYDDIASQIKNLWVYY